MSMHSATRQPVDEEGAGGSVPSPLPPPDSAPIDFQIFMVFTIFIVVHIVGRRMRPDELGVGGDDVVKRYMRFGRRANVAADDVDDVMNSSAYDDVDDDQSNGPDHVIMDDKRYMRFGKRYMRFGKRYMRFGRSE